MTNPNQGTGLTALGKLFSVLLVIGLIALGGWIVMRGMGTRLAGVGGGSQSGNSKTNVAATQGFDTSGLTETENEVPKLGAGATYEPKDNTVDIELSEYAGYAGLIAANGGEKSGLGEALKGDWKIVVSPVGYVIAIVMAFFAPIFSCVIYGAIAAIWFIPDRRLETRMRT